MPRFYAGAFFVKIKRPCVWNLTPAGIRQADLSATAMPTRTTLTIPQPCHENWAIMTPTAQGRHCAACNKVVVDFTQKTDAEILALLQRNAAPCGRFRAEQLDRPLLAPLAPAPRWRTWLAATATVLGLREVTAEPGYSQQPTAVHHDLLSHDGWKAVALHEQPVQVDSSQHIIRGKVIDKSTSQGLPGVTVLLKNTNVGISTGPDGSFELVLPPSTPTDQLLIFSSVGFMTVEKRLDIIRAQGEFVQLTLDTQVMGLIITRAPYPWHPRSMWHWARSKFQR